MSEAEIRELVKAEKREYNRVWRANNRERALEHNRKYWERRAMAKLAATENERKD